MAGSLALLEGGWLGGRAVEEGATHWGKSLLEAVGERFGEAFQRKKSFWAVGGEERRICINS